MISGDQRAEALADAKQSGTRLIDMGLEPFNVASALNSVTAQRLLRRICDNCQIEASYPDEYVEAAKIPSEFSSETRFGKPP